MKTVSYLLLATLFIVSAFAETAKNPDPVVATVNGRKIKKSTFLQEYRQARMFVNHKKVTKENVINNLINRELGVERSRRLGIDKDPSVRRKLEDVMYHAQISKDLTPEFKKIKVTDQDVKNYYQTHREYKTAHILFRLEAIPPKAQVKAAIDQALQVYNKLRASPDSFSELANKYSQANVSQNGGNLGFQPSSVLAPEYFRVIHGKKNGFISTPVRTQYGIHIIKVLAVKSFDQINMPLYKKTVYDIKRDKIINIYHQNLKRSARIKVNKNLL